MDINIFHKRTHPMLGYVDTYDPRAYVNQLRAAILS